MEDKKGSPVKTVCFDVGNGKWNVRKNGFRPEEFFHPSKKKRNCGQLNLNLVFLFSFVKKKRNNDEQSSY